MDSPYHNRIFTYPTHLGKELHAKYKKYILEVPAKRKPWKSIKNFITHYTEQLCDMTHQQTIIICDLLKKRSFDFITVVYTSPDRIQHALGHEINEANPENGIGKIYQACDQALGQIIENLGEDWTIFLVSDHGAQAYHRVFELSTWLEQMGWLNLHTPPKLHTINRVIYSFKRQIGKCLMQTLDRNVDNRGFLDRIQWEQTKAFSLGAFGNIYINSINRFSHGIVPANEYDQLLEEISAALTNLRDPETNQTVVKAVHKGLDIYDGPMVDLSPDLLLETTDDYFIRSNLDHLENKIFYPAGIYQNRSLKHTAKHNTEGILIASGKMISHRAPKRVAQITDIAPSILYMYNLPIPNNMDGKPLLEWIDEDFIKNNPQKWYKDEVDFPIRNGDDFDHTNKLLENRLKDLGYL